MCRVNFYLLVMVMVLLNNGKLTYPFSVNLVWSFILYTFELKNEIDTHNGFIMSLAVVWPYPLFHWIASRGGAHSNRTQRWYNYPHRYQEQVHQSHIPWYLHIPAVNHRSFDDSALSLFLQRVVILRFGWYDHFVVRRHLQQSWYVKALL